MIRIAIVDDNQFYINDIKTLLKKYMDYESCEIFEYLSEEEFLKGLENLSYDIVFLDIVFDGHSGIDIGLRINEKQPDANVIFVSAYPEYFEDVYRVSHSYFLMKEFDEERFKNAITKAMERIVKKDIVIRTKDGLHKISTDDIVYLEGYLKHTRFIMKNGDVREYNVNIKDVEKSLNKNLFVRTHQSFIVNMEHIVFYNRQKITMRNERAVPISRTYISSAREKITLFLGGVI